MVSLLAVSLFTAAFAASFWAMYITVQPRIGYMRALLRSETVTGLLPAVAPRARNVTRSAATSMPGRPLRAAA